MLYRNWTIRTYSTYLGFVAQYTSPIGEAHQTSAGFASDDQATSYAKARIDYLLNSEFFRAGNKPAAPKS